MADQDADGAWVAASHGDRYHGQIEAPDGRRWWVVPRLHLGAGWSVEVRMGSPDGELTSRSWHPTYHAARREVGRCRVELAELGAHPSRPAVEAPPSDRGLLVIHGYRGHGYNSDETWTVGSDLGPSSVCGHVWLPAGSHTLSWRSTGGLSTYNATVVVEGRRAAHVHPPFGRTADGEVKPPPWYHRCRLRKLEYVSGALPIGVLIRADGTPLHV